MRFLPAVLPAAVIALSGVAGLTPAAASTPAPAIAGGTRANLLDAMHGEAFARAKYLAYATQAEREGHPAVARLYRSTAGTELGDHFHQEAGLAGLVRSDAADLRDAISGENYETTTMYPSFERQARADGDLKAATLFHEIGADEADHRNRLAKALKALGGSGGVPRPPAVTPVAIPAAPASSTGRTLANLKAAMHGEAFASAKYLAYAAHARSSGRPAVARLFTGLAAIELREHFAGEGVLAGLVSGTRQNLSESVAGENWEATSMYPGYARQATAAGDVKAAAAFGEIGQEEARHRNAFAAARGKLPGS